MKIASFKKVSSLALASAMALGAAFYAPSAAAVKKKCVDGGCGYAYVLRHAYRLPYPPYSVTRDLIWGGSQDRKKDGWAVWQRLRRVGGSWPGEIIKDSKDNNATWNYYSQYVDRPLTAGIRLYRADGRYLTLLWGS